MITAAAVRFGVMKVCVIGAGSLGSAIGGTLAAAGNDVVLVTRNSDHVAAINAGGLVLNDGVDERSVEVSAATGYDGLEPVDLAIVLVKSFDTGGDRGGVAGVGFCRRPC